MLLIISEPDDATTDNVINWLKYYNVNYFRINNTNFFDFFRLYIDENGMSDYICKQNDFVIKLSEVEGFWYRRGKLSLNIIPVGEQQDNILREAANNYLLNEYDSITEFIYSRLHSIKFSIGNIYENNTNKLINLLVAKKCGLNIPKTWILTHKKDLKDLLEKNEKLLTKTITQGGLYYETDSICIEGQSNLFTYNMLDSVRNTFAPTLFQEYIEKAYELRVFYFNKKTYTTAIFSQNDEMTKIDFRNYNFVKPNRTPPYKMPQGLEESVIKLMTSLDMKSGSIDILVTPQKEYFFLEINPIGQFHQVSYPCNFYIEKMIAKYFSDGIKKNSTTI